MNVSKLLSESVKKVSACILEMSVKRRCILFLTTLLFGTVWVSFYFTPDLANTLFPNRASKKGSGFQPVPEQQLPWQRHSLALSSLEISSSLQLQGCSRVKVTSKWGNYALLFAEILSDVFFLHKHVFHTFVFIWAAALEAVWSSASLHVKQVGNLASLKGNRFQVCSQFYFSLDFHLNAVGVLKTNFALIGTLRRCFLLG